MERGLSAILVADMVGYSRLMEADEVDIIRRQKTHRTELIDPVADETRLYISLDAVESQALAKSGYVRGVGPSDRKNTKYNYTEDPYYTDGNRIVLFLSDKRKATDEVDLLPWEDQS